MNRNYKLDKDTTQRLLDLAVEDNLVKLHKKVQELLMSKFLRCAIFDLSIIAKTKTWIIQVGTKGNKAGVEEDAYRLPTGTKNIKLSV